MPDDYSSLGLKIGLELHQQLNTKKLFCNCSTEMKEQKQIRSIKRRLRPAVGELGKIDKAALFEFLRNREFCYHGYDGECCLVDTDDQPPGNVNNEALQIALSISLLLNMEIPDEIHVMRKTVLDGSAITSFQRTMLIGFGSSDYNGIRIRSICLEEDASKPQESHEGMVTYSLSRLGIPLIELATEPDIRSPEQCHEIAEQLGLLFRSFNAKRGIGTIRQDVNISIAEGSRVEIKGWQDLKTLTILIKNEIERQKSLVKIKKLLLERGFKISGCIDVSDVFGDECYALKFIHTSDLLKEDLCKGRDFITELLDYPKSYGANCAHNKGEHYRNEFSKLEKLMECNKDDVIIIMNGRDCRKASAALEERARELTIGIPEETRKPNPDGTSSFSRPLPGSERMYPETDCMPIKITKVLLDQLKKNMPKTLNEKRTELERMMPKEIASQLVRSKYFPLYEKVEKKIKNKNMLLVVATTFTSTVKDMARNNIKIDDISESDFEEIFSSLDNGKITAKAIAQILETVSKGETAEKAISVFEVMDEKEIEKIIKDIIKENPGKNSSALMGLAMGRLKGKAEGKTVIDIINRLVA